MKTVLAEALRAKGTAPSFSLHLGGEGVVSKSGEGRLLKQRVGVPFNLFFSAYLVTSLKSA
jgi:hypothetical protein